MSRRDGQIIPKGEKKWLVRWFDGYREDGRRRYKSEIVEGAKVDAEKKLPETLMSRDHGTYVEPKPLTVSEYVERWLDSMRDGVSERTRALYATLLRKHVCSKLGARPLQKVSTLEVQGVIDGMENL